MNTITNPSLTLPPLPTSKGQQLTRQNHFDNDRMAGSIPVWAPQTHTNLNNIDALDNDKALGFSDGDDAKKYTAPSLSFDELLDILNPLHHLPVVGNVYRQITGDEISPVARIAGGGIYGGPVGAMAALANAAMEEHAGQDLASTIIQGTGPDTQKQYGLIDDDERMAGGHNFKAGLSTDIQAAKNTYQTSDDMIAAAILPAEKPDDALLQSIDLDQMPDKQAVKEVVIARAPAKQQWNFNT